MLTAVKDYLKGMMNGKTTIPTKAWKDEYTKLTAERKTLNQRYLALKEEVKEAEKIRKSVYSILRQEQRERLTMNGRPKQPKYARNKNVLVIAKKSLCMNASEKGSIETTQEVEIYFNFVGRYVPPHFGESHPHPGGTGGATEERGTQGQATPELFAAQG